jgi:hypothetical protein
MNLKTKDILYRCQLKMTQLMILKREQFRKSTTIFPALNMAINISGKVFLELLNFGLSSMIKRLILTKLTTL